MSERSNEHAWKVCVRVERTEGSNPSLSATFLDYPYLSKAKKSKNILKYFIACPFLII